MVPSSISPKSTSPKFISIYKKHDEIERKQNLPEDDIPLFEERLVILCTGCHVSSRLPGGTKNREYVLHSRQKKAQGFYLGVLERAPDILFAFLLTVSPRQCVEFDLSAFLEQHIAKPLVRSAEANNLVWRIAVKHNVQETNPFTRLTNLIFKCDRPATESEGEEYCSLKLSGLPAIRITFGDIICDAVESSPNNRRNNANGQYAQSTECIGTKVFYNHQDTIIYLDVGCALQLADILFPSARQRIASALSQSNADSQTNATFLPETQVASPCLDFGMKEPSMWKAAC
jgi:hypothetical protein